MNTGRMVSMLSLMGIGVGFGQFEDIRPEDRPMLERQALNIFEAAQPLVARASASTVEVRVWRKRVGFGTVVAPERVLSKWSDVRKAAESLSCRAADGKLLAATVIGVYEEDDLALLEVKGLKALPIDFADAADLQLGSFLTLARPDGEAGGMGVVSVLPRSLRQSDRAFLGVIMDTKFPGPGVKIDLVEEDSGAGRAKLRRGDVVLGVNDTVTNGSFELSSVLQKLDPGEAIKLRLRRGEAEAVVDVTLGGRRKLGIPANHMETMNRMGGHRYSRIVEDFARVIQTDMQIQPEDCGAPVVDLDGRVIGIALARAGRIKSFILPAESVQLLLAQAAEEPDDEGLALRWEDEEPLDLERRPVKKGDPLGRAKWHMEDLERIEKLLDELSKGKR